MALLMLGGEGRPALSAPEALGRVYYENAGAVVAGSTAGAEGRALANGDSLREGQQLRLFPGPVGTGHAWLEPKAPFEVGAVQRIELTLPVNPVEGSPRGGALLTVTRGEPAAGFTLSDVQKPPQEVLATVRLTDLEGTDPAAHSSDGSTWLLKRAEASRIEVQRLETGIHIRINGEGPPQLTPVGKDAPLRVYWGSPNWITDPSGGVAAIAFTFQQAVSSTTPSTGRNAGGLLPAGTPGGTGAEGSAGSNPTPLAALALGAAGGAMFVLLAAGLLSLLAFWLPRKQVPTGQPLYVLACNAATFWKLSTLAADLPKIKELGAKQDRLLRLLAGKGSTDGPIAEEDWCRIQPLAPPSDVAAQHPRPDSERNPVIGAQSELLPRNNGGAMGGGAPIAGSLGEITSMEARLTMLSDKIAEMDEASRDAASLRNELIRAFAPRAAAALPRDQQLTAAVEEMQRVSRQLQAAVASAGAVQRAGGGGTSSPPPGDPQAESGRVAAVAFPSSGPAPSLDQDDISSWLDSFFGHPARDAVFDALLSDRRFAEHLRRRMEGYLTEEPAPWQAPRSGHETVDPPVSFVPAQGSPAPRREPDLPLGAPLRAEPQPSGHASGSWQDRWQSLSSALEAMMPTTRGKVRTAVEGALSEARSIWTVLVEQWEARRPPTEDRTLWSEWWLAEMDQTLFESVSLLDPAAKLPASVLQLLRELEAVIAEAQAARQKELYSRFQIQRITGRENLDEIIPQLLEPDPEYGFEHTTDPRLDGKFKCIIPGRGGYRYAGGILRKSYAVFYRCGG